MAEWRRAFDPITAYIERKSGREVDRAFASQSRTDARRDANLGELPGGAVVGEAAQQSADSELERLLDTEIIAVYW